MIALGLVLVLAGAAVGLDLALKTGRRIQDVPVFGVHVGIHSVTSVFFLGAISGAAVALGLGLLLAGIRRQSSHALSRRREHRELQTTQQSTEDLQTENRELRRRLDSEAEIGSAHSRGADIGSGSGADSLNRS